MSRIESAFLNKAKIAYLTVGDSQLAASYFIALTKGGCNILELGIPFSDPIADGPIIQAAMNRALATNTNLKKVLEIVAQIRKHTEAAIILFTYYNPIFGREEDFLQQAKHAGADGILVVDLPYEESLEFRTLAKKYEIAIITVIAPSTTAARIKYISTKSTGFLYYASRQDTTGIREDLAYDLKEKINVIRQNSVLPIAVGFGIANKTMVNQVLYEANADGCVIGSYFINAIQNGATPAELEKIAHEVFHL